MQKGKYDANQRASSVGQPPSNVQLIFTVTDAVNYSRFTPQTCNEVCIFLGSIATELSYN